jgi:hypothetical protein
MAGACAVLVVASLVACAASSPVTNAQAQGKLLGSAALQSTATAPPAIDEHSMNSGWKNTAGCPEEVYAGMSAGIGSGGTITRTDATTASGPNSLPSLTSHYVPSCAFTFTSNGVAGKGELFFGMGLPYETDFESAVVDAGFVLVKSEGVYKYYRLGVSVIGLGYIPEGTNGFPYSVVAVFGVN